MSIKPLREAADAELCHFHENWNRIDVPENWSLGCLKLLLDADADFAARARDGITAPQDSSSCILSDSGRDLFKTIMDCKMLELNLDTPVEASLGWYPQKAMSALGPLVICKSCSYPRSVTIMAADDICGLCETKEREKCKCSACERVA